MLPPRSMGDPISKAPLKLVRHNLTPFFRMAVKKAFFLNLAQSTYQNPTVSFSAITYS